METIQVSTRGKQAFHDITDRVQGAVRNANVEDGICLVFCPHTTAGITLNENWDTSVQHDLGVGLNRISPPRPEYRHAEGNSPAHLKSSLVGAAQLVPIDGGRLALGRWQGIFLAEFDGPRTRKVYVKVMEG
ncbi:MAG: secondary thiamine-phosphate synthase enzyme YjbQ [Anaerolineae bacterium]|jgi:secondary thiamine-phosphate synthase enzyme